MILTLMLKGILGVITVSLKIIIMIQYLLEKSHAYYFEQGYKPKQNVSFKPKSKSMEVILKSKIFPVPTRYL